LLCLRF